MQAWLQAAATVPVVMAVLVIAGGVARAPMSGDAAPARLAAGVMLGLEFLLAAGLLRLSTIESFAGLAAVAAIVVLRKVVGAGIHFAVRALGAHPPASPRVAGPGSRSGGAGS